MKDVNACIEQTLYQQGTLTLTELAAHIRVDRSTLGEMITRMASDPWLASAATAMTAAPPKCNWRRRGRACC